VNQVLVAPPPPPPPPLLAGGLGGVGVGVGAGGLSAATMMFTGCEVVVAPSLSVATAVRIYAPTAGLVQLMEKGDEVVVPINVAPR